MKASDLLESLRKRGVRIQAGDNRLIIDAPNGVLTESLLHEIAARKPELLTLLGEPRKAFRVLPEGPYAGFLIQDQITRPDPARAQEAFAEAERWRQKRAVWLRDILGVDSREGR